MPDKGERRPMIDVYYPSCFEAELSVVSTLKEDIEAMTSQHESSLAPLGELPHPSLTARTARP
jgi:hypothetical protein